MPQNVSILLLTHGDLGKELISSARLIIGEFDGVNAVSLLSGMAIEEFLSRVRAAIDGSAKTIILTDLYGGTPNNTAMMLGQQLDVEVLSGVNLSMLIELINSRDDCADIKALINSALEVGREAILRVENVTITEEEENDF